MKMKDFNWGLAAVLAVGILSWVLLILLFTGCARHSMTVERDGVKVHVDIAYLLQDKQIKSVSYDPATGQVTIIGYVSETSEVASSAITAALTAVTPVP